MPAQETYFEAQSSDRRVEVIKTYDVRYARQVLDGLDEVAQSSLWKSLQIDEGFDPEDIPEQNDPARLDVLWDEVLSHARESHDLFSFFVVNETERDVTRALYVSPDWPSAELFAKARLGSA